MNAPGYAADFAQFLRAGRIDLPEPELQIALDGGASAAPTALVSGTVHASQAQVRQLFWRMRGDDAWSPAALQGGRFAIAGCGRAGTMELRSLGAADGDGAQVIAWAFLELAWPAAQVDVASAPAQVLRHSPWSAQVSALWIEELTVTQADGSLTRHAAAPGEQAMFEVAGGTGVIGHHVVELAWRALDGNQGAMTLEYEVGARPMRLEMRASRTGGLYYRAENAEALELLLHGAAAAQPLPSEGVIENSLLAPLCGVLRYRDEAGQWRAEPVRLDHSPRGWPQARGFAPY
ncbi:hypothetical protein [Polaromonas sp.]|uniref:hypothetical protein n=1 Tax=Polaromonas sp. TaxID=1869339 RepID=UPI002730B6C2|nr:hypothetical protein [Polaromonas sp.]MDP1740949.1 hypothetical protein [Polaromonas sp.]